MFSLIARATALFERIPGDLIAIVARIGIATTFLRSGLLKLDGWSDGNTLALFTDEYKLPLIPPEIAATMATAAELSLPVFIHRRLLHAVRCACASRHDARHRDFCLSQCFRYSWRVGGGAALSDEIWTRRRVAGSLCERASGQLPGQRWAAHELSEREHPLPGLA